MPEKSREQIEQLIKNLQGVLKTSVDQAQRVRVYKDIQKWKTELERVIEEEEYEEEEDEEETYYTIDDDVQHSGDPRSSYPILKNIPLSKLSTTSTREINEIYTFLTYIEEEYLGLLSEYHLKIDFSHSLTRDSFYTDIHDSHSALKLYAEAFRKANDDNLAKNYQEKLKLSAQAEYRNLITKLGDFFRNLYKFVEVMVTDFENGGHLVTNPDTKLTFDSSLGGSRVLEGCTVIEGLKDLYRFLNELLDYLNFPEIKK